MGEIRSFDAAEYLGDREAMAAYLEDAMEDSVGEFLEALGVVARAMGMTDLAARTGVARPALYRSLRSTGHPDINTVAQVMSCLGLKLNIALSGEPKVAAVPVKRSRQRKALATA